MNRATREQRLRQRLTEEFHPLELTIQDESDLHAGHAGAAGGASHFRIRIVAEAFRDLSPVARHRMIYGVLAELMRSEIHALAIDASAPPVLRPTA